MPKEKGCETGPAILRPSGFECVKAIIVYVTKTTGHKTIDTDLMLMVVFVIDKLCQGEKCQEKTEDL